MKKQIGFSTNYIVYLNSGSPELKVVNLSGDQAQVEWANERGNLERMTLPAVCFSRVISN
jgi:hypothetical protein